MINRLRKRWWVAAVLLAVLFIVALFAGDCPAAHAATVDDNYWFNYVNVIINVNRDKTFDITETLQVEFRESGVNTGVIRDIQRVSKTTRVIDGTERSGRRYIAGLDGVEVTLDGEAAKVTRSLYGDFHSIKMQTPDESYLEAGEHEFVLKYRYDMSDDGALGYDDFTLDVLGYAMAYTEAFSAQIIFLEGTDLSDVSFRTNGKAEWRPDSEKSEFAKVEDNVISVFALPHAEKRGYTVQVILPNGYFETSLTFYWYYVPFALLALIGMLACVGLFLAGRINRKVLTPVEYLPPDIDIMRFSAVWHNGARYKDVGALVLQWAAKGLVNIEPDGKRHFLIIPDKSLNDGERLEAALLGMKFAERRYFEALFINAGKPDAFSTKRFKKRIAASKRTVYESTDKLVEKADEPKPYLISGGALGILIPFLSLIPTVALMLYYCVLARGYVFLFFIIFFGAGTFVGTAFNKTKFPLMLIFPLAFYGGLYFIYAYMFVIDVYDYAGLIIIAPLWWALCLFVLPHFTKGIRSPEARGEYAKIYGFRQFLLYTELDRIQLVFDEHPDYFAEIAPYCYIMGIGKKVQKRFASLSFVRPAYMIAGLDPDRIGRGTSHSCHHSSGSGGGRGGGSHGGGGGGGGSHGGGGGGGGSRGC